MGCESGNLGLLLPLWGWGGNLQRLHNMLSGGQGVVERSRLHQICELGRDRTQKGEWAFQRTKFTPNQWSYHRKNIWFFSISSLNTISAGDEEYSALYIFFVGFITNIPISKFDGGNLNSILKCLCTLFVSWFDWSQIQKGPNFRKRLFIHKFNVF